MAAIEKPVSVPNASARQRDSNRKVVVDADPDRNADHPKDESVPLSPGPCQPNPVERGTGTLADVITGGTGLFEGATGQLTGTVSGAVSNTQPAGASVVQLSGTITLAL
jgi:hypothetical protein